MVDLSNVHFFGHSGGHFNFKFVVLIRKNTMGNKKYPPGTNHFSPFSPLFKPSQRTCILPLQFPPSYAHEAFKLGYVIVLSNIGLVTQTCLLAYLGRTFFLWSYLVPYLVSPLLSPGFWQTNLHQYHSSQTIGTSTILHATLKLHISPTSFTNR